MKIWVTEEELRQIEEETYGETPLYVITKEIMRALQDHGVPEKEAKRLALKLMRRAIEELKKDLRNMVYAQIDLWKETLDAFRKLE